ncbi:polysaccharide pyruvyl transferase family protein [Galbitalea soli]|uniref:Polysaccharide pyruvyl transferase domain-containing protein n=1 Tax=Galbitalea soli TaxID=1268042 RepID=A0A7C9PMY6_9MICO|nr:polysaccharide pyruvyl transferase family protein [Galbitalea soli]NEM91333.1 hypothetical protein [Galbitalea soli]NYJ30023.1 polysaccharide pyruvyl transferase WcaK-like protein [Galbitalea soli]
MVRILIHNSDSPENRGDRAILVGLIDIVRREFPDAEIWSLSPYDARDAEWYGINFLKQSPYSTNLLHWWALLRLARRSDLVLWGGGEILKDYTNRLGLVYWLIKMTLVRLANRTLIGAFQGIGPTSARSSQRMIRACAELCRVFLVRDAESQQKLEAWGTRTPVIASFDPAVMGRATPVEQIAQQRLSEAGVTPEQLRASFGLGLRRWFHYRHGGWLPNRFKRSTPDPAADARLARYKTTVARLADELIERHDLDATFFPMHLEASEGDAAFAAEVVALMTHADRTRIVAADGLSPADYAGVIGATRFFVASRLHSAILATMAGVPSFVLYYVDKGRLYFEQLGLQRYSAPIASVLDDDALAVLEERLDSLVGESAEVKAEIATAIEGMSTRLVADFRSALDVAGVTAR